jgi:hypothetical protein
MAQKPGVKLDHLVKERCVVHCVCVCFGGAYARCDGAFRRWRGKGAVWNGSRGRGDSVVLLPKRP